jgi:1,6-anhydro-N-acetylmuramate kinase
LAFLFFLGLRIEVAFLLTVLSVALAFEARDLNDFAEDLVEALSVAFFAVRIAVGLQGVVPAGKG